jgi:tripartite-type tricarboxylate transporter receptor subunit TctC
MRIYPGLKKLLAIVALCLPIASHAAYPDRPIRMIVNYPPGGMTDVFARPLGKALTQLLGVPVLIENRGGAGGTIGAEFVARSAPDGYTLILGTFGSHAVNDALFKKLPYNSLKDFSPVCSVAAVPSVLSVNISSPIKSLAELLAAARAKPDELTHASTGIGASPQLLIELLKRTAHVDIRDIMYNGGGPAMVALLGNQVTMIFDTIGTSMPQIKAKRIRPLAISSSHRSPVLPDVPTVAETLPGFEVVPWFAIWAPAHTPSAIVEKLNHAINTALQSPDIARDFASIGAEVMGGSVADFAAFHRAEYARWGKFIRETGITIQ